MLNGAAWTSWWFTVFDEMIMVMTNCFTNIQPAHLSFRCFTLLDQPPKPSLQSSPSWPGHSNPLQLPESINQSIRWLVWLVLYSDTTLHRTYHLQPPWKCAFLDKAWYLCLLDMTTSQASHSTGSQADSNRTHKPATPGRGTSRETVLKCANPNHGNLTKKHCNLVVPTRTMSNQCKIQKL